jgi:hypothetical protein
MLTQAYIIYLLLSVAIALWVGRTLSRNGRVFLVENFEGNDALADSVNHLLLVGFYLINFGFISLALRYGDKPETIDQTIEFLSTKIGLVIMLLGAMHFFNMRALIKFRNFKWVMPAKGKEEACAA